MRLWVLTMIAAAGLSAIASTVAAGRAGAPEPGTRGPVIQTVAPAPTPTRAPVVLSA